MGGWFVLPVLRLTTSAALSGQQCPADAAGAPGRRAPAGQRARRPLTVQGPCPEPAGDGGARGRGCGPCDRAAQHAGRADGGDGVLRRLRRPRPGVRAPPGALGVLGGWRGGADDSWRAASPWRQLNLPQIRPEPPPPGQGPRRAGAVPADRRRERAGLVRRCQPARRGGGRPARRAADRPPRRGPIRPALRLGAPAPDRQRRRDPRPPGPVHRLAVPGRQRRARAALAAALSQILARPVGTPTASAA
jgi:hypothetical protein